MLYDVTNSYTPSEIAGSFKCPAVLRSSSHENGSIEIGLNLVGIVDGDSLGVAVGVVDGDVDGDTVGVSVGIAVGDAVGVVDGVVDGVAVGDSNVNDFRFHHCFILKRK